MIVVIHKNKNNKNTKNRINNKIIIMFHLGAGESVDLLQERLLASHHGPLGTAGCGKGQGRKGRGRGKGEGEDKGEGECKGEGEYN